MQYVIQCASKHGKVTIDHAVDRVTAEYLTEEYSEIYGPSFRITFRAAVGNKRIKYNAQN